MTKHYLKGWRISFNETEPKENRARIAKLLRNFWKKNRITHLEIPGWCRLQGEIPNYGNYNKDSISFMSSSLKSIDRVTPSLMCANTTSGNKYYFDPDDYIASYDGYVASNLVLF